MKRVIEEIFVRYKLFDHYLSTIFFTGARPAIAILKEVMLTLYCLLALNARSAKMPMAALPKINDVCPFCGLDVLKDTKARDFKVTVSQSGKSQTYRCILCALADVKESKGNLTISAPSEQAGKPVKIARTDGKWTVTPDTAEFVYIKGSHEQCQLRYRAITAESALEEYRGTNPKMLADAKALTLADLLKKAE